LDKKQPSKKESNMAKGKAVAKTKSNLPATLAEEMAGDAGDGLQNFTTQDLAIPFIRILQKMSPQLGKRDGAYIEGAEEGEIFNTVTGELWDADKGIKVVPCAYNFKYILWKDRDDGGGFVNSFTRADDLPETTEDDKGRQRTKENYILSPTAEYYVLLLTDDEHFEQAVISMSSTQLKHARKWGSLISQQTIETAEGQKPAPIYSRIYDLTTVGESNDHGDWSGWKVELGGVVQSLEVYRAAKNFATAIGSGKVEAKHGASGNEDAEAVM